MKRLLALILALMMLLSACVQESPPTEPSVTTEPATQPSTPPEIPLTVWETMYQKYSTVEVLTSGAVKKYVPDVENLYAICPMGDGLLLFSGEKETQLTLIGSGDTCQSAVVSGCFIVPDGETTHVSDDGICYFDDVKCEIVHLDAALKETSRTALKQRITGRVLLSKDGANVYYMTSDALRWLEISTGISRMLTQMSFDYQELVGIHFDGSVLACNVSMGDHSELLYISAETGQVLSSVNTSLFLHTHGEQYFAQLKEGSVTRWAFGKRGEEAYSLLPRDEKAAFCPLFGLDGVLSHKTDKTGTTLEFYDMTSGKRTASARLAGVGVPLKIAEDVHSGAVWFMAYSMGADQAMALYCWSPEQSPTGDDGNYVSPYYTSLDPDTRGLSKIAQKAKKLADQYNIRIRVGEDAVSISPSDYNLTAEYLVQAYEQALPVLEQALASFPEGFFKKLGSQSNNRVLTISLVREAHGSSELGSLEEAVGVHFWNDGNSYLALVMGGGLKQTFYHELFHSIDTYVLTETLSYDFWEDLNPSDFHYDYSYVTNQYREDYQYLEEETRAFIDMYSMSYPKEDRARVMEYAVMDGCEAYFASDIMQAKLKTVCKGIREAFGLKKDSRVFLWEQYLKEPLAKS